MGSQSWPGRRIRAQAAPRASARHAWTCGDAQPALLQLPPRPACWHGSQAPPCTARSFAGWNNHDPIYTAYQHFGWALYSDWTVRTENPW